MKNVWQLGLVIAIFAFADCALAIEIEIHFPLLEKQLSQQLFTQDGRRYVKGSPTTKCSFAYLAAPKFSSRQGKLVIRAQFSGRSSLDVFGRCVGFGDSFDVEIVSSVETKDGALRLVRPEVFSLSKESFYSRQVIKALQASVGDTVKYPIREEIRKILEAGSSNSSYQVKIQRLEVKQILVLENTLLVDVDTRLLIDALPADAAAAGPKQQK